MLIIGSLILGATTLQEFSIALLVGLIVGGYSSLFVASFVVAQLKEREPEYVQIANKVAKKSDGDDGGTRMVDSADVLGSPRRSSKKSAAKETGASSTKTAKSSKKSSSSASGTPTKTRKPAKTDGGSTPSSGPPPKPRKTKKKKN